MTKLIPKRLPPHTTEVHGKLSAKKLLRILQKYLHIKARFMNTPPQLPKRLAEKFAKLSQQHMERQEQQRQQQKKGKNKKNK